MNKKKGKLVLFCAPSGAGKTTLVRHLLGEFDNLEFSVSATTRPKRENETDGADYFFLTEEKFLSLAESDGFLEWEKFYDYYYGTLRSFIEEKTAEGKNIIFDIDVKGAENIKNKYPEASVFFVAPPDLEALKKRLIYRQTESDSDLRKRFERMDMEMEYKDKFDYVIINDNLEEAKAEAKKLVKNILSTEV